MTGRTDWLGPQERGSSQKPLRVVPKEEAVFWMDGQGRWRNAHGRFEHPRIARRFHSCIHWDEQGFYLFQEHPGYLEKIYFPCEDTALFAIDFKDGSRPTLVLNTGKEITLEPESLFIRNDSLYQDAGDRRIKLSERVLIKLCRFMDFEHDPPILRLPQGSFPILCRDSQAWGGFGEEP